MTAIDIHEGYDGWLFLTGGSNHVLRLFEDPNFFSENDAVAWWTLLEQRKTRLEKIGTRYLHLIVPDKLSVFRRYFDKSLPNFSGHPLARMHSLARQKATDDLFLDCTAALDRDTGRFPTFYKTDSHWTVWGAYLAYRTICRAMQLAKNAIVGFDHREFVTWPEVMDLGSKLPLPRKEDNVFTPMDSGVTRRYANAVVDLREKAEQTGGAAPLHHGIHLVFSNNRAGCVPAKLIIFGDSFCDYRPSTLTAFFAETFAETHFVWSSSLDYDYINENKPHFVLTEIAERFMTRLPTDDYDVVASAEARVAEFDRG